MDTPIVSPWFFYWISVVDKIEGVFITGIVLSGIVFVGGLVLFCITNNENRKEFKKNFLPLIKLIKKSALCLFLLMSLAVFCPSKSTLIEMMVAKNITPAIIETGKETVKLMLDYIFERVEEQEAQNK